MSASPLLKAQLYNRAEVEQYSEKLLAQVGPQLNFTLNLNSLNPWVYIP